MMLGKFQKEAYDFSRAKLLWYEGAFPMPGPCHVGGFSSARFLPQVLARGNDQRLSPEPLEAASSQHNGFPTAIPLVAFQANPRSKTLQHPGSQATPSLTPGSQLQGCEAFSLGSLSQLQGLVAAPHFCSSQILWSFL